MVGQQPTSNTKQKVVSLSPMQVNTMSKQHLIFMPENGKKHFKFTTDLQIQNLHDSSSCKTCKARVKQCMVNVHANQVQNQILVKQRECAKLWNETLDLIMKGKTPDRIRHDSSLSDVICLDIDMEDNDIEEVHTPLQLPLLSPINNLRIQMHTPSKTPNTMTPTKRPVPNQHAKKLGMNMSEYNTSTPSKQNLVSNNQTPVKMPPSAKKPLSSNIKKYLIYSKQHFSEDHVFWVNKFKKQVQEERRWMHILKGKLRKAKNYANFLLAASLESEIQVREKEFAEKHIQRIQVTENLSTYKPMHEGVREAIYNPIKSAELFEVRTSRQQQCALNSLRQFKENLLVLQQLNNKYAPLVANELYYKEQLYKKVYLTPRNYDNILDKNDIIVNVLSTPQQSNNVLATPQQSNKKLKKILSQEKRSKKRKQQKRLNRLKKMGQILGTAESGNKVTTVIETIQNKQSESTMKESLKLYDHNITISSESSKTPTSSHASPRPNNIQSLPCKISETTPVKLSSATKFQPYRSMLGFPPVDS
ncbi:hypothetical protein WDU94_001644 [Cyamophila willieti]